MDLRGFGRGLAGHIGGLKAIWEWILRECHFEVAGEECLTVVKGSPLESASGTRRRFHLFQPLLIPSCGCCLHNSFNRHLTLAFCNKDNIYKASALVSGRCYRKYLITDPERMCVRQISPNADINNMGPPRNYPKPRHHCSVLPDTAARRW